MANVAITPFKTAKPNSAVAVTATALTASGTGVITYPCKDANTQIRLENTAGAANTVTFEAGNSHVAVNDLTIALASGETKVLGIDSARFLNLFGDNVGKILVTCTGNLNITVVETRV